MCDRILIHQMVPGDIEYFKEEVRRYLEMTRPEQLAVWRQKRATIWVESDFDEYGYWIFALSIVTGEKNPQVPNEILQEEQQALPGNHHRGNDGDWLDWEKE